MIAQIIRSLIIVIITSSCAGGIYYFLTGELRDFLKAAILAASIQILFFFLYNNILRYIARLNLEKESIQLAQLAEKNKIFIECQGCKNTNNIDIDLTTENNFKCINCDAENKVNIEFTTILPTKPIYDK